MTFSLRLFIATGLFAAALLQVGCLPKIDTSGRTRSGTPTVPATGDNGGGVFELPKGGGVDGPGGWETTTKPAGGGAGAAAKEKRWEGVVVYFGYDKSTVGVSEQYKVEALAKHLLSNPDYYVIVEGHCDNRGSDEYNRALGERRALAVKSFLVSLGVAEDRVRTVAYGEEKPAVPDAATETEHAKNRRAEFVLGIQ
ncbi:MAG: OmpA family protein [Lentisphaeria bacterium]|nr:OmpA family protein [Lentisphaeria bacterium]